MRIAVSILIVCMFVIPVRAATVGCPVNFPEEGGFIVGIEINEFSEFEFSNKEQFGVRALEAGSSQYVAKLMYGVNNWVEVTAKMGSADFRLHDPNIDVDYTFSKGTIYGPGIKAVLYENAARGVKLCGSMEYIIARPGDSIIDNEEYSAKWKQWDNALYMVFSRVSMDDFSEGKAKTSFYIGGKYSQTEIDWVGPEDPNAEQPEDPKEDRIPWEVNLRADDNITFFAGVDIILDTNAILCGEARIGNIDSYTFAFCYRF